MTASIARNSYNDHSLKITLRYSVIVARKEINNVNLHFEKTSLAYNYILKKDLFFLDCIFGLVFLLFFKNKYLWLVSRTCISINRVCYF